MRAIDDDVGPNAAVLYRIKQDAMGNYRTFAIDQVTGMITLRQQLDRERQKIHDVSLNILKRVFNVSYFFYYLTDSCRSV